MSEKLVALANENLGKLKANIYPGRGIVQGLTPSGEKYIQIYWIMGRSENSRNRIFVEENGFVRTAPFDASKMTDPSLIIYYPARFYNASHIVSNGDQTDTVYEGLQNGVAFEKSLESRKFEPDTPNYTPRITGMIDLSDKLYAYKFSILRSTFNDPDYCERLTFSYEKAQAGLGYCVHTYAGDADILPSFSSYPYHVPVLESIEENLELYWNTLNADNRISLLVKEIDIKTGNTKITLKNCHE